MQTEAGPAVPPKPLQPSMSMRPYLTYELGEYLYLTTLQSQKYV